MMKRNTRICVIAAAGVLAITSAVAIWKGRSAETTHGLHLNFTDESVEACRFGNRMTVPDSLDCATWNVGCESEHGYYFIARAPEGHFVVSFADRETGTTLPLCPRPNCTHDGNTFCTASTKIYTPSAMICSEKGLYSLALKHTDPDNPDRDKPHQVLLRYAFDGTSLDEVCDFGVGSWLSSHPPVIHRGYAWCFLQKQADDELEITHSDKEGEENFTGFQLWGVELKTGKTHMLLSRMPVAGKNSYSFHMPEGLFADGDYLYFQYGDMQNGWIEIPDMHRGVYRLSLITGEMEVISYDRIEYLNKTEYLNTRVVQTIPEEILEFSLRHVDNTEQTVLDYSEIMYQTMLTDDYIIGYKPKPYASSDTMLLLDQTGKVVTTMSIPKDVFWMGTPVVQNGRVYVMMHGRATRTEDKVLEWFYYDVAEQPMIVESFDIAEAVAGKGTWRKDYEATYLFDYSKYKKSEWLLGG